MDKKISFGKDKRIEFYIILGLILILVLPIIADAAATNGKIRYGVKIGDIPVGLLSRGEAKAKLEESIKGLQGREILILGKDKNWHISPEELKASVNVDSSIDKALKYGREGGFTTIIKDRILAWVRSFTLPLEVEYDEDVLAGLISSIADEVNVEPIDATITMDGSDIDISKSTTGLGVDKEGLKTLIAQMIYQDGKREIPLTLIEAKPFVTEGELLIVKDEALRSLKDPLTLKFEEQSLTLKGETLRGIIAFLAVEDKSRGEGGYYIKLGVDEDKLRDLLERKFVYEGERPKDATFEIVEDKVRVVAGKVGVGIDYVDCISKIEKSFDVSGPQEIVLKVGEIEPRLTSDEAKKMGINELVSRFTTNYPPNAPARISNIHLLASSLNGTIVPPGAVFSFNDTIGPRTAAKGYKEAPTIIGGKLIPTIGGGVCQVGSTIFNTAFFAGYPIVERTNHSFYISKYPIGRDATVSYGDKDFKFRNDTEAHILIKASYTASSITVAFYSTNFGTEVAFATSSRSNPKNYGEDITEDPSLASGQRVVDEAGFGGFDITVYRTVKRGDAVVLEDKFFSRYRPKNAIVRIGPASISLPAPMSTPNNSAEGI